jgi:purine-binding chemotaxis protein CheW
LSTPVKNAAAAPGAQGLDASAATVAERQFVTFKLAGETFAVPMAPVQEIIRVPEVARMPLAPPALDGLSNLRGRVLPIVSLRRLFGLEALAHDDATRALVINLGQPLGFVVDRVASVVSVEAGEIQPATTIQSIVKADFLTGVIHRTTAAGTPELMLVLDFERLVNDHLGAATGSHGASRGGATAEASTGQTVGEAAADELRLVSFTVDTQEYAIAIAHVQEIVQVPAQITAVPNTSAHVLGLISLRHRLLPLVSLRCLFGLPEVTLGEQHRIVVVALPDGSQVGLVTDTVKEVLGVPRQQADAMPPVLARSHDLQEFESICRLDGGKRLVSIIAADKLLGQPAFREAAEVAARSASAAANQEDALINAETDDTRAANQVATEDDAQVVIFRLGDGEFAVPIMSVQEIVRVPDTLTRVPRTPRFVEGVINLRGTVLPVIDQRTRLGMDSVARNDGQRIMVYTLGGLRTGFIVDSVAEVLRIPRGHIEAAPVLSEEQGRLITQVAKLESGRRLVMMIDPGQLLGAKEAGALARMQDPSETATSAAAAVPPLAKAA